MKNATVLDAIRALDLEKEYVNMKDLIYELSRTTHQTTGYGCLWPLMR